MSCHVKGYRLCRKVATGVGGDTGQSRAETWKMLLLLWLSLLCQGPWSEEKGLDLCPEEVGGTDLPKSSGGGSMAVIAGFAGGHQ